MRHIHFNGPLLSLLVVFGVCEPWTNHEKIPKRKSQKKIELNSFAFTFNDAVLPVYSICGEKISNNKKWKVERHFKNKHWAFAEKCPAEDEWMSNLGTAIKSWRKQTIFPEVDRLSAINYSCSCFGSSGDCKKGEAVQTESI